MDTFIQYSDEPLATGRLAMVVAYSGGPYQGWQAQKHAGHTVQAHVEHALSAVASESVTVTCAGRTDAGVHAAGQVIHFDTGAVRSAKAWIFGGNHHLPPDIRLLWVNRVCETFHARHSATARHYRYILLNQPVSPAWANANLGWYHKPLDVKRMHEAAHVLLGEHDFSAFRAAECQSRTPVRRLTHISVERDGDLIWFNVTGNAFLHHMVRNIVGSLLLVGAGKRPVEWLEEVLVSKDRRRAGPTAPASGLYFWQVSYPDHFGLPQTPITPPFRSTLCEHV